MGGNIFGNSIIVKVISENVQSNNTEKPNAEGFDIFLLLVCIMYVYRLHFYMYCIFIIPCNKLYVMSLTFILKEIKIQ